MKEWRDVKDFEGLYEVSESGEIRSKDRIVGGRRYKGRLLAQSKRDNNYSSFRPSKDGEQLTLMTHRVVAEAFCYKPNGSDYVNHIDGDKQNNHYKNLEWVTQSENLKHAFKNGLKQPSFSSNRITLTSINGETVHCQSQREASRILGVSETTIRRALKNSSLVNGVLISRD